MSMKELAKDFILEAEDAEIPVEDLIGDFAKECDVDAIDLYVAVRDLKEEDEKKCQKIDKLID